MVGGPQLKWAVIPGRLFDATHLPTPQIEPIKHAGRDVPSEGELTPENVKSLYNVAASADNEVLSCILPILTFWSSR